MLFDWPTVIPELAPRDPDLWKLLRKWFDRTSPLLFPDMFRQLFEKALSLNHCHSNQTKDFTLILNFLRL